MPQMMHLEERLFRFEILTHLVLGNKRNPIREMVTVHFSVHCNGTTNFYILKTSDNSAIGFLVFYVNPIPHMEGGGRILSTKFLGRHNSSSKSSSTTKFGKFALNLTLSGPGGGLRGPDGQTHSCQSETSYPMMPKLGDF